MRASVRRASMCLLMLKPCALLGLLVLVLRLELLCCRKFSRCWRWLVGVLNMGYCVVLAEVLLSVRVAEGCCVKAGVASLCGL